MIIWFAKNHVAANLMMVLIIVSGLLAIPLIDRKIIPQISYDIIEVKVVMPGAGPTQIERNITQRIEQALFGLEGILDVKSQARKNLSITTIEISHKVSLNEMINKVQALVNAVTLPQEALQPVVREIILVESVIGLAVSGDIDLEDLNYTAQYIAAGLREQPDISVAYVRDGAKRNFLVEVTSQSLARYRVSFDELVKKLRAASADISGATFESASGEVSIVGDSEVNSTAAIEALSIRSQADGSRIRIVDVAEVKDTYIANDRAKSFDGKNVVFIGINRAKNEDLLKLAEQVEVFLQDIQQSLPPGVQVDVTNNIAKEVSERISMLSNNAFSGFFLVLLILLLFMNFRLSFWTSLGIPISFLGAFFILFYWGGSINMISLFAFILVLGIVVDDAIIVGESIYSQHQNNNFGIEGAIKGTLQVARPVFFAVATTMVAFSPMLFMPGEEGRLALVVPVVVISVLAFSLIESLFILPAHLASIKAPAATEESGGTKEASHGLFSLLDKIQTTVSDFLDNFITNSYRPFLDGALLWRYTCIAIFAVVFFLSLAILGLRWVNINVVSEIESDILIAKMKMVADTSAEETRNVLKDLEKAGFKLQKELNEELGFEQIQHVVSSLDDKSDFVATVSIYLNPDEKRELSSQEIGERLRENFGDVPNLRSLTMKTSIVDVGGEIDIALSHYDLSVLREASQELRNLVNSYDGVLYAWDTLSQGKREIGFSLKPTANDLGVSTGQIAGQIRQAFHGEDVYILDESGNRTQLKVRYTEDQRSSLWSLENLPILLKDGSSVPLYEVVDLEYREAPALINLHNGKRSVRVIARLDQTVSAAQITKAMQKDFLNAIDSRYVGMQWKPAGGQQRGTEALDYLLLAYPISLLVMYIFMAILFSSYSQPLMIMAAIPFGIVGALIGHIIMGIGLTLWSLIGIVAVSGVVVNDNLVLVDRINQSRKKGMPLLEAIREAGAVRFRPIILTSVTTFLGLTPLMLESSVQAQFLIPMAISLSFGVVFATLISLVLVPVLYAIFDDAQSFLSKQQFLQRFSAFIKP